MTLPPQNQPDPRDDETEDDYEEMPMDASQSDEHESTDEEVDVSAQFQEPISKMEQGTWHAPHGRGVKIGAMIILTLVLLSIITMLVMAIIGILS